MFTTLLANQAHCALADFWGKLGCLPVHSSIVSRVGAFTKPGLLKKQLAERMLTTETDDAKSCKHRNGTNPKIVTPPNKEVTLAIPRDRTRSRRISISN
nr:hypothetical protein [Caballeronia novacaledonica]